MLIDVGSPEKYVSLNELPEITSNNIFSRNSSKPDPLGLGSYEIFGNPGSEQRKKQFAFISLGDTFIHPMVLETMIRLKKIIKDVVYGNGEYYIKNGAIFPNNAKTPAPDGVDVGCGCHWLQKHLREIVFDKTGASNTVQDRINFIKSMEDDEIFIDKWLVIPPYYRDVDVSNGGKKSDINMAYQALLAQAGVIRSTGSLFAFQNVTDAHRKMQDKLNELYTYYMSFIAGTKAFMQQHVLGKSIDYAARMVISTPKINADCSENMEVDFSHSAVPLSMVLECFAPYIVYGFKKYIKDKLQGSNYLYYHTASGITRIELAPHWENAILSDNIKKLIKLYTDSKEHRLDVFTLESIDGKQIPLGYIETSPDNTKEGEPVSNVSARPLTLCELFYIVAMNTIKDKSILITRYPVEDYHNIYPSLMNIIPYYKTKPKTIDGLMYPRFPDIREEELKEGEIASKFTDTLHMFPTYLEALNADFDGDTVSVQGVWTKNSGSRDYIYSKTNIINIGGGTMRGTKDITAHTLYALTRGYND